MLKTEQAEFWTDLGPSRGRAEAASAVADRVRGESPRKRRTGGRTTSDGSPQRDWFRELEDRRVGGELEPLAVSEPVDVLERRRDETEDPAAEAKAPTPAAERESATMVAEEPVEVRYVAPAANTALVRGEPWTRFSMARFLTLTGSLDTVEDVGRWLELPKRGIFRSVLNLGSKRRISRDFIGDLRSPPRTYRGPVRPERIRGG